MDQINKINDFLWEKNPSINPDSIETLKELLKYAFSNFKVNYHFKETILWPILGSSCDVSEDCLYDAVNKQIEILHIFSERFHYIILLDSVKNLFSHTKSDINEVSLKRINTFLNTISKQLKVQ